MASQSWATIRSRNRSTIPMRFRLNDVGNVSPGAGAAAAAGVTFGTARTRLLALPFVIAASAPVLFLPRAAAGPRSQTAPPPPPSVLRTWLADCAICHGADARGTNRGPSLNGDWRASVDYELTTGRMPITDPGVQLGNPNQVIRRHKPYYDPPTINGLEDYIDGITGGTGSR